MKSYLATLLLLSISLSLIQCQSQKDILKSIDTNSKKHEDIAHTIWQYAELGYQEEKSSTLLQETLKAEGFRIETGVAEIPTAFIAS